MQRGINIVKLQVPGFHSVKFSLGLSICLQINIYQSFTNSVCFQKAYSNLILKRNESVQKLWVYKYRIWELMISFFFFFPKHLLQCRKDKKKATWEMKSKKSLPGWVGCTFLIWMLAKEFSVLERQTRSSLCENMSDGSKFKSNLISSTSCQFSQMLSSGREHWWVLCVEDRCSIYSLYTR